jgi:hypothetical protein
MVISSFARVLVCLGDNGGIGIAAAAGGHRAVLEWARSYSYSWSWRTTAAAAGGGHLDVLKWLRANGCEWSVGTCAAVRRI